MDRKIVIIGAGHGGLYAAKMLADAGAQVTIYEKSDYETISHDRTDCIEVKLFNETGLPKPEGSYIGQSCSFIGPYTDEMMYIYMNEENRDVTVGRKEFAHMLIKRAEGSGVKFVFGAEVSSLIVDKLTVRGIRVGGEDIFADLVIDASGLGSPFRAQIPEVCGITAEPDEDEVFNVYHASYQWAEGVTPPEGKEVWKLYLKYAGKKGISWVNCERENDAAILIGAIGELTESDFRELFARLKQENPIIGEKRIMGGQFAPISVRYPCSVIVSDGYALIGDSAFMTIPILGSGLANAIRAGQYLAEEIIRSGKTDIDTLWSYQLKYFKKIGGVSCVIDAIKRALLDMDNVELKYIFEAGIVSDDDIKAILNGELASFNRKDLARRLGKLFKAKGALKTLTAYLTKGLHAMALTAVMPKKYSLIEVNNWKKRFDKAMK